jgi:tRNA(Ile)-lysidine synthase
MARSIPGKKLVETVGDTMRDHSMVPVGSAIVAGVSGGPDSMALMHLLHELSTEMSFSLVTAHVDHGLRVESEEEAAFVRSAASKLGLRIESTRENIRDLAARRKISLEEAGRRARYSFFEEVRRTVGAGSIIATAHHRDDALETFFLRIFRGSSITGLGGIPPVRGKVVRPLIRTGRDEILRFLDEEKIPFLVDPTNLEAETDRNYVRNRLFPVIRERFPRFGITLARTLDLVGSEEEFLAEQAAALSGLVLSTVEYGVELDAAEIAARPEILAARVVRDALYRISGPDIRWTRRHVAAILAALAAENPSSRLDLPRGIVFRREYDRAFLEKGRPEEQDHAFAVTVDGPGTIEIPLCGIRISFRILTDKPSAEEFLECGAAAFFDADDARFPLTLRSPRPGDRFRPWGMDGTRKLNEVLIDRKVPMHGRRSVPVLVKDRRILWIAGVARSDDAPLTPRTGRVLKVELI